MASLLHPIFGRLSTTSTTLPIILVDWVRPQLLHPNIGWSLPAIPEYGVSLGYDLSFLPQFLGVLKYGLKYSSQFLGNLE